MHSSRWLRSLVVLGLVSLGACSDSAAPAVTGAGAPAASAPAAPDGPAQAGGPAAEPAAAAGASAPVAATHDPVDVKVGGLTIHMEGNTITSNGPATGEPSGGFSVVGVRVESDPPLKLTVRIEPALAPKLLQELADQQPSSFSIGTMEGARVEARMTVARPSFTLAGRTLDVTGGRLTVCGIAMGPIADYDTITLAPGEVRVEDVFRGPLPAPVAR